MADPNDHIGFCVQLTLPGKAENVAQVSAICGYLVRKELWRKLPVERLPSRFVEPIEIYGTVEYLGFCWGPERTSGIRSDCFQLVLSSA